MREKSPKRVANACNVANLGEGLDQLAMQPDSPSGLVKKLKVELVPRFPHGARIAQNLSLRRSGVWGSVRSVRRQANSFRPVRAYPARRVFCYAGHESTRPPLAGRDSARDLPRFQFWPPEVQAPVDFNRRRESNRHIKNPAANCPACDVAFDGNNARRNKFERGASGFIVQSRAGGTGGVGLPSAWSWHYVWHCEILVLGWQDKE
jgi:hypothetical protein